MEEVVAAADPAYAAVIAVKLLLGCVVIEKVALHAHVATKGDAAGAAGRGHGLPRVTEGADDF